MRQKTAAERRWTTTDELAYIERIGMHYSRGSGRPTWLTRATYRQKLTSYLATMRTRYRWGEIHMPTVLAHVKDRLAALQPRP